MSDEPEKVVRDFFAAWADPKPGELGGFFHAAAVWVDGPQGVRSGAEAVTAELAAQLKAVGGATVEVKTLVSNGNTVMVEQVHTSNVGGNPGSQIQAAVRPA